MTTDGVTMWGLSLTRDHGGERWKYPRVQWWLSSGRYPNLRIGWRDTAWGIHVSRDECDAVVGRTKPGWLQLADITLHSGRHSTFKVECDNLTDGEVAAACALLAKIVPPFGAVAGVPRGGLRIEEAMRPFVTHRDRPETIDLPLLIVDDVWTTGGRVAEFERKFFNGARAHVAVLFARGPVPAGVTALWTIHEGLWSA